MALPTVPCLGPATQCGQRPPTAHSGALHCVTPGTEPNRTERPGLPGLPVAQAGPAGPLSPGSLQERPLCRPASGPPSPKHTGSVSAPAAWPSLWRGEAIKSHKQVTSSLVPNRDAEGRRHHPPLPPHSRAQARVGGPLRPAASEARRSPQGLGPPGGHRPGGAGGGATPRGGDGQGGRCLPRARRSRRSRAAGCQGAPGLTLLRRESRSTEQPRWGVWRGRGPAGSMVDAGWAARSGGAGGARRGPWMLLGRRRGVRVRRRPRRGRARPAPGGRRGRGEGAAAAGGAGEEPVSPADSPRETLSHGRSSPRRGARRRERRARGRGGRPRESLPSPRSPATTSVALTARTGRASPRGRVGVGSTECSPCPGGPRGREAGVPAGPLATRAPSALAAPPGAGSHLLQGHRGGGGEPGVFADSHADCCEPDFQLSLTARLFQSALPTALDASHAREQEAGGTQP